MRGCGEWDAGDTGECEIIFCRCAFRRTLLLLDLVLKFLLVLQIPFSPEWRVTFFACTKKVTKEMHPGRVGPQKSMGASLAEQVLLQGRMDAPSRLIHAEMHIPVHFALAKPALLGNA